MKILLLGTYELGRQPFGLASPAAWLRERGHEVRCCDLSRESLDEMAVAEAGLVVFYLPMHTATRLALPWARAIRGHNQTAKLCACGLYAPLNEPALRGAGFDYVLGAEFEAELAELADALAAGRDFAAAPLTARAIPRLQFVKPDRGGLPALREYAHVILPDGSHRVAGYTEASRGCKHLCRHCPVVPVYAGQFRIVPVDVVLADIRQQVTAGAEHITFGDPDFFNGVTHAMRIVEALHAEFPRLTYDVTIKIEHLLRHAEKLPALAKSGCLFITSAVESLDDQVLRKLEKGHTRADFFSALELCRRLGLDLQPTFVPFTPWTTRETYADLLEVVEGNDLVNSIPSVQLSIRLLIPSRSRLLELQEIAALVGAFDEEKLVYPWRHPEPALDALAEEVTAMVGESEKKRLTRTETFGRIWQATMVSRAPHDPPLHVTVSRRAVSYLSEPWYC